jgi:hypothetical protein
LQASSNANNQRQCYRSSFMGRDSWMFCLRQSLAADLVAD